MLTDCDVDLVAESWKESDKLDESVSVALVVGESEGESVGVLDCDKDDVNVAD